MSLAINRTKFRTLTRNFVPNCVLRNVFSQIIQCINIRPEPKCYEKDNLYINSTKNLKFIYRLSLFSFKNLSSDTF